MSSRKRTFDELRLVILMKLLSGQQTTNQLSLNTGINWRTAESHLTFLIGKGLVTEVLKSEYVRIFKLTDAGKQYTNLLLQQKPTVTGGHDGAEGVESSENGASENMTKGKTAKADKIGETKEEIVEV